MKKIYLLFALLSAFALGVGAQAKIGYLVFGTNESDCGSNVKCLVPSETDGNSQNQSPEQQSIQWFYDHYMKADRTEDYGEGKLLYIGSHCPSIASAFTAENLADVDVLWIPIGRNITEVSGITNLLSDANKSILIDYIKSGKNIFLSGYATYFAHYIGRVSTAPNEVGYNIAYENNNDPWGVRKGVETHAVWNYLGTAEDKGIKWYTLVKAGQKNNRNCLWNKSVNFGTFETSQVCKFLGYWSNTGDADGGGFVEFYPKDDWKGTIIVNGLAAYQWGEHSAYENMGKLTHGILEYLSASPTATWETAPKANPVIKDEENVTVTPGTNCTVTVTTSDPNIANYNVGHIYYNFFGNVTFTATATGDGVNIPKNAVLYPETRTVTGGAAATYGYILPFSFHTISANGYNGDGNYLPDYLAALWFYNEYVSQGTGCFINPAEASIPSQVKVLWINSDKNGLSTENFDAAYASTEFVTTLTNFYNAGGNLLLTKQAVRMLRKLGRYNNGDYPTYAEGTNTDNNDNWNIRNSFFAGDGAVNYSSHLIFKELGSPFTLIAGGGSHNHRTDNNNLIYDEVFDDKAAMQSFEDTYNCRILGTWPNAEDNKCDRGVLVEFLPQIATAGTIIEVGASAYQWNDKGTIDLKNVHQNMKKLTSNILSYLYSLTTYTRTVTNGNYGTICLPRASESTSGATFYKAVGKILDSSSNPSDVVIEEVASLEAGVPYIFQASADEITVNYTGAAVVAPNNSSSNGLIGSFIQAPIANNANYYILQTNELRPQYEGSNFVGANRAYFDLSAMSVYDPSEVSSAPRRRMSIQAPMMPTGIEQTQSDKVQSTKVVENGVFYIIQNGVKYNAQGQRVNQ